MTITVITGTPGAGKTLYTIEKLIIPEIGKVIKGVDEDGVSFEVERKIYTNVNGLLLEHELIEGGGSWDHVSDVWHYKGNPLGLRNWHNWAPKGAIIVFDEVQKVWPKAPNGSRIPPDLQGLDTHRHMGVDFVLITQTVNNVHGHIYGLGGRHLHVRRVGNMKMALVYEWDHISKALQYSKAIAKSPWRYSKKVFKLYKSSELHTKVKRSTPPLLWAVLFGLAVSVWGVPAYFQKMKAKTQGGSPGQTIDVPSSSPHIPPVAPPTLPASPGQTISSAPAASKIVIAGCVSSSTRCLCMDSQGVPVEPSPGYCQSQTAVPTTLLAGGNVDWYPDTPAPPPPPKWNGTVVGTQKGWQF